VTDDDRRAIELGKRWLSAEKLRAQLQGFRIECEYAEGSN